MSDPQNNRNRENKEIQHEYYLSQVLVSLKQGLQKNIKGVFEQGKDLGPLIFHVSHFSRGNARVAKL